ncbi:MAG: exodeoxyribonuclease alpha subunit [Solirubrobacteraceae bacterium]|nr:exodeoxyribonuclease alpha subunit [Solirubrobacteraceae bacterium]
MPSTADPFDVRRAFGATGLLAEFNAAGVLAAADVHVARRIGDLLGEGDESVRLAAALAVRAPRIGHVHVDLATIRDTATVETADPDEEPVDLGALPWPDDDWVGRVSISRLVSDGPLRLEGSALYLDRYWQEERQVAADLLALNEPLAPDEARLADGLARLFADDRSGKQALAAETAARRRLAIVAGGPGTGKTTTVARILALLYEQDPDLHVALAAPTGKAQSRLQEAVATEARRLHASDDVRARILDLRASTLHRLLGWRPDNRSRFRHHRGQRLPHDVVIVDETSMVSLSMMARLVEAIRDGGRLILVGDPGQLASVEAGAVLGDIVRAADGPLGAGIVVLDHVYRYDDAIARLAEAIRAGDADAALAVLGGGHDDVRWVAGDAPDLMAPALAAARAVRAAALADDGPAALGALAGFRILCAHRRDVAAWTERLESALAVDTHDRFYPGRPLLVTSNDYDLGLFNGDTGVVVGEDRVTAAFERGLVISPARLGAVDTAYAMTIHKAQGSQFHTAAVLLPDPNSRILTRELLYTACTRAQQHLILAGTEASIRTAIDRPIARASGLRARLEAKHPDKG